VHAALADAARPPRPPPPAA